MCTYSFNSAATVEESLTDLNEYAIILAQEHKRSRQTSTGGNQDENMDAAELAQLLGDAVAHDAAESQGPGPVRSGRSRRARVGPLDGLSSSKVELRNRFAPLMELHDELQQQDVAKSSGFVDSLACTPQPDEESKLWAKMAGHRPRFVEPPEDPLLAPPADFVCAVSTPPAGAFQSCG